MNTLITVVVIASCAFASNQPKTRFKRDGWDSNVANAINAHDETKAIKLIEEGASINSLDGNQQSLMHYAAKHGLKNVLELLIKKSNTTHINDRDNRGDTPMHLAALKGNNEIVKILIDHGADVNAKDNSGKTPIHEATYLGLIETVKILSDHGSDVNSKDNSGRTPFHYAAKWGDDKTAESLISNSTDVNLKDDNGWTPLLVAVDQGHSKMAKFLIDHGANINVKDDKGKTPIHLAALRGNDEIVKMIIDHGADVNTTDNEGKTPFYFAVSSGHDKTMKILIEHGADLDSKSVSPLLKNAAWEGYAEVVKILIDHGADVNYLSKELDWSPLYNAAFWGHDEVVKILIDHGADINFKDFNGYSVLYRVVTEAQYSTAKILIDRGADIESKNNGGYSPLFEAARTGNYKMVQLLVHSGADINSKGNDGQTARDIAVKNGHPEIASFLDASDTTTHVRKINEACEKYSIQSPSDSIAEESQGSLVEKDELPWMAALGYWDATTYRISYKCGGVVISERWILTAAHCTNLDQPPIVVRLGNVKLGDRGIKTYYIKDIIPHKSYSNESKKNDIALLRLLKNIKFTRHIRPACLETNLRDKNSSATLYVSGWGSNPTESAETSKKLLKAEVQTIPLSQCNKTYVKYNEKARNKAFKNGIIESQYCANGRAGKGDSCHGDSGGPLQIFHNPYIAHVVGIVSFGVSCGTDLPTIYTRVAYYVGWIYSEVWKEE